MIAGINTAKSPSLAGWAFCVCKMNAQPLPDFDPSLRDAAIKLQEAHDGENDSLCALEIGFDVRVGSDIPQLGNDRVGVVAELDEG